MAQGKTYFEEIYSIFLSKITDDMYMELTKEQTYSLLQELLLSAIPWFEFPRTSLDFELMTDVQGAEQSYFIYELNKEEKNILAIYMIVEWLSQQLASVELVRMKYSGSDFKFTSQANHMAKLQNLKTDYEDKGFKLQRLYKRRAVDENGIYRSTFGNIMNAPTHPDWSQYSFYGGDLD